MAFTNEQMERYSRHIILQEVGVKGQKKLLNGKVLIIVSCRSRCRNDRYCRCGRSRSFELAASDHPRHSRCRKSESKIRKRDYECDEPGCYSKYLP